MRLRDFLFALLLPAGFLGGGSWAQRPGIATRVTNAEGKLGLLPRALCLAGTSRGVRLLLPSQADASAAAHSRGFVGTGRLGEELRSLRRAV